MKSRGAGLVVQMELVNFLKEHGFTTEDAISVPAYKRQYISKDGSVISEEQTLQLMTSWYNVYLQCNYVISMNRRIHLVWIRIVNNMAPDGSRPLIVVFDYLALIYEMIS